MKKEYIETMDDLKKYFNSDEYKSMEKEIMELVKKDEINQIRYGSLVFDDKDSVVGRVRNRKGEINKWLKLLK